MASNLHVRRTQKSIRPYTIEASAASIGYTESHKHKMVNDLMSLAGGIHGVSTWFLQYISISIENFGMHKTGPCCSVESVNGSFKYPDLQNVLISPAELVIAVTHRAHSAGFALPSRSTAIAFCQESDMRMRKQTVSARCLL